jgi:sugar/nucleoside kinase (ribokinase family)
MNKRIKQFDLAVIGNYTKDTIVSPAGTRYVDGGGFNYGVHVGIMMGLRVAAVTRLARADNHVVDALKKLGVKVFVYYSSQSTHMRLFYPTNDVDNRTLSVTSVAEPFEPAHVRDIEARAFLINASTRGEVSGNVIDTLREKNTLIAADAQGFIRTIDSDGTLRYDSWPGKEIILGKIDILKCDAVEAASLTGETDIKTAAVKLAELGPGEIVLTHRDGLLVYAQGQFYEAPFLPRQLVGRSGRGDTCIAAYVAKRLEASAREATLWAAAVTSLKMEAEGPLKGKKEEVVSLINSSYRLKTDKTNQ